MGLAWRVVEGMQGRKVRGQGEKEEDKVCDVRVMELSKWM